MKITIEDGERSRVFECRCALVSAIDDGKVTTAILGDIHDTGELATGAVAMSGHVDGILSEKKEAGNDR